MQRVAAHPTFHFWLIGLLAFTLQPLFLPKPDLLVNYPSSNRIAELERQWRQIGQATDDGMKQMIQAEVDRAILLNEAIRRDFHLQDGMVRQRLIRDMRFMHEESADSDEKLLDQAYAMDLHKNDLVVKRRLIQLMESVLRADGESQSFDEHTLRAAYQEAGDQFFQPERVSFSHVFVSHDRNRQRTSERAKALLQDIRKRAMEPAAAILLGEPFITGHSFVQMTLEQVGREFGHGFTASLGQCAVGEWCEAVESAFGLHHVWLHERLAPQAIPFDVVKSGIEADLRELAGDKSLAQGLKRLRGQYRVVGANQ